MKRVFISIFCFLIMFLLLFQCFPIFSNATDPFDTSIYGTETDDSGPAGNAVAKITGTVLTFVQVVGVGVGIITLITLGTKYMTGSVEDKADVKNNTVTYVLAAGICFGGTLIATIVKNFVIGNLK